MTYKERQEESLYMLTTAQSAFETNIGQTQKDLQIYGELLTLAEDEFKKREWDNVMDTCREIFKLKRSIIERLSKQEEMF